MCIDSHRIFTAGISNGSAFSGKLLCQAPYRFAAAGMVSSPFPKCVPRRRGASDHRVPRDRRPDRPLRRWRGARRGLQRGRQPRRVGHRRQVGHHNGCTGATNAEITPDVLRTGWTGCDPDGDIVLLTIQGGGHTWPGPIDVSKLGMSDLGATTSSIDATQLMLDFFDSHPLP